MTTLNKPPNNVKHLKISKIKFKEKMTNFLAQTLYFSLTIYKIYIAIKTK